MAKSQRPWELRVSKRVALGSLPSYIMLGQRHLEKEKPVGVRSGSELEYVIPVDFAALTIPKELVEQIEEIRLAYEKRSA